MKVVFAGGGTGGHLYPAIAIADHLRERGDRVEFIGTADRLEATIVPAAGYPLHRVMSRPLVRRVSPALLGTIAANEIGLVQSLAVLARFRPAIVVATGGYVCFPAIVAARMLGIPSALLEPNAQPGLTNRLLAPLVREVWGPFPSGDARFGKKYVFTGVPVRRALLELPQREAALQRLGLPDRKTLLVMGGSQGARSINDAVVGLLTGDRLPDEWQIVHITGDKEYERVKSALGSHGAAVHPYVNDLSDAYAAADLVLSRAGASTLAELAATGKPAVLVPYPHAADDHQRANALEFASSGGALVTDDADVRAGKLGDVLNRAMQPGALEALKTGAARLQTAHAIETVVARIDGLAKRKQRE